MSVHRAVNIHPRSQNDITSSSRVVRSFTQSAVLSRSAIDGATHTLLRLTSVPPHDDGTALITSTAGTSNRAARRAHQFWPRDTWRFKTRRQKGASPTATHT